MHTPNTLCLLSAHGHFLVPGQHPIPIRWPGNSLIFTLFSARQLLEGQEYCSAGLNVPEPSASIHESGELTLVPRLAFSQPSSTS